MPNDRDGKQLKPGGIAYITATVKFMNGDQVTLETKEMNPMTHKPTTITLDASQIVSLIQQEVAA